MKKFYLIVVSLFLTITITYAQTSSTASELATKMTVGWNIGNSLEVPDGETAWGNPKVTQTLIDAVSDAGFNTVRIPCAWDSYADEDTHEIDSDWLERVKEVVDYCYNNDMYVILNSHWDNGWLEENPTYDEQDEVNEKQEAYWTQIAEYFEDYDEHLLFAGTNEVHYDYNDPSDENIEVQESYNQTFVDAVRATGGNNATRVLVVQTYNTNAWYGLTYFSMPDDDVDNKLMVEIHYYDPYNFTLNSDDDSACTLWGDEWSDGDVCSWGQEDYMDDLFDQVKSEWVDNDIPVIIGEFGVIKRTDLTGDDYTEHVESREYYLNYLTSDAVNYGIVPIYWDNGVEDYGMALFDRSSGDVVDEGALDAIISGAGATSNEEEGSISLTANAGDGYITLNWTTSNIDIRNIQILRDTDSDPSGRSRIATPGTDETSYTDTDVEDGTTYYYWVKIVDTDLNTYNSDAASATTESEGEATIVVSATPGDEYVTLNWTTENIDIKNIQIMRDTDSDSSGRTRIGIASSSATSYTDSDVDNGTSYYYWVKIVDTNSNTYNSTAVEATPADADGTITLSATPGNGSVTLNWSTSDIDIRNIQVYRNTSSTTSGRTRIGTAGSSATSYTDSDVDNGTTYYYWLKIVDTDLDTHNSGAVEATPTNTSSSSSTGVIFSETEETQASSSSVSLDENYPNPFESSTTITFCLDEDCMVKLAIYNIYGKLVCMPVNNTMQAGSHTFEFNADKYNLSAGIYIYRLITPANTLTKSMIKK